MVDTKRSLSSLQTLLANNTAGDITPQHVRDFLLSAMLLDSLEISITTTATATLGAMHVCSGTSADYTVTLPTAVGNAGKFMSFRMSNALSKLVTIAGAVTEAGDVGNRMSNWYFNGITIDNSNAFVLYWQIVGTTVTIYKDSAGTNSVATGTVAAGVAALTQTNSSNIFGSVDVTGSGDDTTVSANTLTCLCIDGATKRIMWAGEAATLISDGAQWCKTSGRSIPMQARIEATSSESIAAGSFVLTALGTVAFDVGALTGTANTITARRTASYVVACGGTLFGVTAANAIVHSVFKAGVEFRRLMRIPAEGGGYGGGSVAVVTGLTAGDALRFATFGNAGTITTEYTAGVNVFFLAILEVPSW